LQRTTALFKEGVRAAMVAARLIRKKKKMSAQQTIQAFVMIESAYAHANGDGYDIAKAEIDALNELIKRAKAELDLCKDLAVDQGYAERKEIWTAEHVVKGHYKRRFMWR